MNRKSKTARARKAPTRTHPHEYTIDTSRLLIFSASPRRSHRNLCILGTAFLSQLACLQNSSRLHPFPPLRSPTQLLPGLPTQQIIGFVSASPFWTRFSPYPAERLLPRFFDRRAFSPPGSLVPLRFPSARPSVGRATTTIPRILSHSMPPPPRTPSASSPGIIPHGLALFHGFAFMILACRQCPRHRCGAIWHLARLLAIHSRPPWLHCPPNLGISSTSSRPGGRTTLRDPSCS